MPDEWITITEAARILDVSESALHARKRAGVVGLSYQLAANPDGKGGLKGQFLRSEILQLREIDKVTAAYSPAALHALGALISFGGKVEDKSGRATATIRAKMNESYSTGTVSSGLAVLEGDNIIVRETKGKRTYLVELTEGGRDFIKDNLAGLDPFLPKPDKPRHRPTAEERHAAEVEAAAEAGYVAANTMDRFGTPGASDVVVSHVEVVDEPEPELVEDEETEDDRWIAERLAKVTPPQEPEPEPVTPPPPDTVPFPEPEVVPAPPEAGMVVLRLPENLADLPALPGLGQPLVVQGLALDDDGEGINLVLRNGSRSWTVRVIGTVTL